MSRAVRRAAAARDRAALKRLADARAAGAATRRAASVRRSDARARAIATASNARDAAAKKGGAS